MAAAALAEERPVMALRGTAAALSLSVRRLTRSKFMLAIVILTTIPVAMNLIIAWAEHADFSGSMGKVHDLLQAQLRTMYLHFIIFFTANILGFAVMRQDVEDQTLHYLLLRPTPRWMLVLGKLLAYLAIVSALCIASYWLCYFILGAGSGLRAIVEDLLAKGRLWNMLKDSGVMALGLLVYGALAMLMGLFFKSGFYALLILAWEAALPYLPRR